MFKPNLIMKLKFLQTRFFSAFVFVVASMWSMTAFAQPANDLCSNAIELTIAADEASAVPVAGTTVGTVDGATTPGPKVCSANFYRDDVWYKVTIPSGVAAEAVTIAVNRNVTGGMTDCGMAIYVSNACDTSNAAYLCQNFTGNGSFRFSKICTGEDKELLIRVWSGAGTAANWAQGQGAFEISAFYSDGEQAIWGNNGEGSFNGGLGGWTTTLDAKCPGFELWRWSNTTYCTNGAFSSGGGTITSLTVCNGAMCFDSDYYDNNGQKTGIGTGPCTAPQEGSLVSPAIDLSVFPDVTGVNLVFSQATRQFQSEYYIELSLDEGTTWNTIEINTAEEDPDNYAVNGPHVNNNRRVFLPGAAGKPNVQVRFRYVGNYYYWIVDDVKITERESYNLRVDPFYAIAPNKQWQRDQLESFGGLADISNNGSKGTTNTALSLEIKDAASTTIFTDELSYGTTVADSTYENVPMTGTFTHPNDDVTTYTGTYALTSTEPDFDYTDNSRNFSWSVTDSIMAKDGSTTLGNGIRAGSDYNYTWGNIYHIVNNKSSLNGKTYHCNYAGVGIANPDDLAGATIFVYLYKWDNANGDDVIQADERTTVGFNQYDFPVGEAANTLYTLPIFDYATFEHGVALESNTDYVLVVEYTTPPDQLELPCFINSDASIDYGAQTVRSTTPGFGPVRYNHALDVGNTGEMTANTFTGGTTPVIRMFLSTTTISTNEVKLDDANKIVVAPNPVKDVLNVKIDLVENAKEATIEVVDINGKILNTRTIENFKSTTETFDVSNLVNGNYFVNYKSKAGVRSVKFIVAK